MRALLVLIFAAACGDDGVVHHLPDAPPPPDDAPDAAVQPVTLKVTVGGVGQMGVKVFFQRADFSLVSMKLTDAAGEASETVAAGAFVTALDPFNGPTLGIVTRELRTFAGVKPGDHLTLALPAGATLANVTFIVPADPDAAAASYHLYTGCGDQDVPGGGGSAAAVGGTLTLVGCGTASDIVIESRDVEGTALHALYHPAAAISDNGTIDLTADAYQATVAATFDYTNVRDDIPSLAIDAFLYTARGRLVHANLGPTVTAGVASATIQRPNIAGSIAVTSTQLFPGAFGIHHVLDWGPPGPYALDANILLPEYTGTPTIEAAAVTWTSTAGPSQPDALVLAARFTRESPLQQWNWLIAAPYTGTALTFPTLAGDAAGFTPIAGDTGRVDRLITAKVPGGYDAVRPVALSIESVNDLVAGGSGHVVFEELGSPPAVTRHAHAASR